MQKVALSPVCVLSTFAKNQLTLRYGDARNTWEAEVGRVEGDPQLHSEFKISLSHKRARLKKQGIKALSCLWMRACPCPALCYRSMCPCKYVCACMWVCICVSMSVCLYVCRCVYDCVCYLQFPWSVFHGIHCRDLSPLWLEVKYIPRPLVSSCLL